LFGDGVMPLRQNTDYVIRINASQTSLNGVVVTKNVPNQPEIDSNGRLSGDKLFVRNNNNKRKGTRHRVSKMCLTNVVFRS
jgi:hypothetical protein